MTDAPDHSIEAERRTCTRGRGDEEVTPRNITVHLAHRGALHLPAAIHAALAQGLWKVLRALQAKATLSVSGVWIQGCNEQTSFSAVHMHSTFTSAISVLA